MNLRWPTLALVLITAPLFASGAGDWVRIVYPVAAVGLGLFLEARSAPAYVGFVLWLWVLSPLVRRVADFQAGWQDPSVLILTPYLVTAICVVQLFVRPLILRTRPLLLPPGRMVFVFVCLGIALGLPIGLSLVPSRALLEALNWLLPPAFGWWLASSPKARIADIEHAVGRTLFDVMLVIGAYGLYQFMALAPWDADWMRHSEMTSIGYPEPLLVRVFSTTQSPGVLALFLIAPITLWLANPTVWRVPALCLGSAALLLSQVRAGWIALLVTGVLVFPRLSGRARARAVLLGPATLVCVLVVTSYPEIWEVTTRRLATFAEPIADESAMSRWQGHLLALADASDHPFGRGIGVTDARLEEYLGMRDSVFLAALVQFGIAGAVIYAIGFCGLVVLVWGYYRQANSSEQLGLASAGIGLLSVAVFGTTTAGPPGVLLWTIGGLAAASRMRCVESFFVPAGLAIADVTCQPEGARAASPGGVS